MGMGERADGWDPELYERFARERAQPFHDLLAMVEPVDGRAVDLGCGTGELTVELHRRSGATETVGLDSSPSMLAAASRIDEPGVRFEHGDIAAFAGRDLALVFSNAALHWLPDHEGLLGRLAATLAAGGQLAVQVPAQQDQLTHRVAARVAEESPFRGALDGFVQRWDVRRPEEYARILHGLGFREQRVELRVYPHLLPSREEVVRWVEGTTLTPYRRRLSPASWAAFLSRYRDRLFAELPDDRPFFLPFKRILFWARRDPVF